MTTKKKDLEIVCNLQWKNVQTNAGDKLNVVGVYDIPAVTLNWDIFKSYMLKNSGTQGDDVRVYYMNGERKEIAIDSQMDFQIALYYIRQQARMGEIVTLVLDRVTEETKRGAKPKRWCKQINVQTQVGDKQEDEMEDAEPPEWFDKYMSKFKKKIVEEVTATVSSTIKMNQCYSQLSQQQQQQQQQQIKSRKMYKKVKRSADVSVERDHKKTLKIERKLDNKLERLEHKTSKIKAKKLDLFRKMDPNSVKIKPQQPAAVPAVQESSVEFLMDARPVDDNNMNVVEPHMNGGETYKHCWEVYNSGKLNWTSETELRYAWGSQALTPVDKRVPCPPLRPGEKGQVVVQLNVPEESGNYESYWHFHHMGRRFGHWLGCHVIVDESPSKGYKYETINIGDRYELLLPISWTRNGREEAKEPAKEDPAIIENKEKSEDEKMLDVLVVVNDSIKKLNLSGASSIFDDDEESGSVVSVANSTSSSNDNNNFVMIDGDTIKPDLENVTKIQEADRLLSDVAAVKCEEPRTKENLGGDFDSGYHNQLEARNYCETNGESPKGMDESGYNTRLFVFPEHCPGFEVVYPSLNDEDDESKCQSYSEQSLKNESNGFSSAHSASIPSPPRTYENNNHVETEENRQFSDDFLPNQPQKRYDKVVNGAAFFASSALNTARNVINMVSGTKEVGRWENGRWVSTTPCSKRETGLRALEDMGFWDRNLNATLLARYDDDVSMVVSDLLQTTP